jgi:hypothetical protein
MYFPVAYKLLYYLVKSYKKNYKRFPKRTDLIKMIYLTDLAHYKNYGEKYSEFDYIYYKKGPWTKQFHLLLEYMDGEEIIEAKRVSEDGKPFYLYNITKKKPRHDIQLEDEIINIVENNLFIYKEVNLQQLLDTVYKEEPMVSTERGAEIDFSNAPLNARTMRNQYKEIRKKQLEKIKKLKNNMTEDDMEIFYQFKPLRTKANELI